MDAKTKLGQWLEGTKFKQALIQAAQLAHAPPYVRRIANDLMDQEKWRYEALGLGAKGADLERHGEIVKTMGWSSPVFSNRQVWRAGWALALRSLSRGEHVIPDDVGLWALRLWNLSMNEDPATVICSLHTLGVKRHGEELYLKLYFIRWTEKAKELWTKSDDQEKKEKETQGQGSQLVGETACRTED